MFTHWIDCIQPLCSCLPPGLGSSSLSAFICLFLMTYFSPALSLITLTLPELHAALTPQSSWTICVALLSCFPLWGVKICLLMQAHKLFNCGDAVITCSQACPFNTHRLEFKIIRGNLSTRSTWNIYIYKEPALPSSPHPKEFSSCFGALTPTRLYFQ